MFTTDHNNIERLESNSCEGHGLFAKLPIEKGTIIFEEEPLIANQFNKSECTTCEVCFKFLCSDKNETREELMETNDDSILICEWGCGEIYCSKKCFDLSNAKGHEFLCAGKCTSNEEPLILFKIHAMQHDIAFLLVAKVFAHILKVHVSSEESLENIWEKYYDGFAGSVADLSKDNDEANHEIENESLQLLLKSFQARLDKTVVENFFDIQRFRLLLLKFQRNNYGVRISSPIAMKCNLQNIEYVKELAQEFEFDDDDHDDCCNDDDSCCNEKDDKNKNENYYMDLIEDPHSYFPPVDGEAMFTLACTLNHSCDPNVKVIYDDSNKCKVIAMKDIQPGEELVHDYLRYLESSTISERKDMLSDIYGFECNCSVCKSEIITKLEGSASPSSPSQLCVDA